MKEYIHIGRIVAAFGLDAVIHYLFLNAYFSANGIKKFSPHARKKFPQKLPSNAEILDVTTI
jgi:hypothetical protein